MKGLVPVVTLVVMTMISPSIGQSSVVTPSTLGQSKACANHYCQNGGLCIPYNIATFYTCSCQPGFTGGFCQTKKSAGSVTTEVYKKHGLIPEMCDVGPPNALKITYAGNRRLENNMAMELTPTQVRYQPWSITWPNMRADRYYTIIMIDPDMPSRTTPIAQKNQVLHWLMVNIPGAGVGGRQLAPYIGSGPPPNTGVHRYTFFVFEEGVMPKDYTGIQPFDLKNITRRVNWNFLQPGKPWTLREFAAWANMGAPIAGNFYQAQWDSWVDQLWRTFNKFYE